MRLGFQLGTRVFSRRIYNFQFGQGLVKLNIKRCRSLSSLVSKFQLSTLLSYFVLGLTKMLFRKLSSVLLAA